MRLREKLFLFAAFLFVGCNYLLKTKQGIDPDFGWHLRLGQLITAQGIPLTDPFSYTMPYYPFVDHEWLTNVAFAFLYNHVGLYGLSVLFTLFTLAALSIQLVALLRKKSLARWSLIPFLLSSLGLILFIGIRPQVISWLLFSLLLLVVLHEKLWRVCKWFLPFLILLWVNLHGSFPLGVAVIGLAIMCHSWPQSTSVKLRSVYMNGSKQTSFVRLRNQALFASRFCTPRGIFEIPAFAGMTRKILNTKSWIIFALCLLATFFNPYGWRVWWEVWMQMSDSSLHWSIQEWFPALFIFNYPFFILVALSVTLILRYWRKFLPFELALYWLLLLMGVASMRHVPFWLLIALPLTTKALAYFYAEAQRLGQDTRKRFLTAYTIFSVAIVVIVALDFAFLKLPYVTDSHLSSAPLQAVTFLKEHPAAHNVFAEYGLGGLLIWQLPEKKVFIDGRMPSWRHDVAPHGYSKNAFAEYVSLIRGERVQEVIATYQIDTVLLNKEEDPEWLVTMLTKFTPFTLANKAKLRRELKHLGWRVVYEDEWAVVYRK